jgi:type-F conjugative transfer system pilin assembly protein TrbC
MAQKKLLFPLILILAFTLNASGKEAFDLKEEDMEFANNLAVKSRQASLLAIKEKWLELQRLKAGSLNQSVLSNIESLDNPLSGLSANTTLRVFVSGSMGTELLKDYVKQAKCYKAILVFNGLPQGSWRKLSDLVYGIAGGNAEGVEMQLDDLAFAEYSVTSVPSFVLSKEPSVFDPDNLEDDNSREVNTKNKFDKIVGNIGIKRALETMIEHGDLANEAHSFLQEAKG